MLARQEILDRLPVFKGATPPGPASNRRKLILISALFLGLLPTLAGLAWLHFQQRPAQPKAAAVQPVITVSVTPASTVMVPSFLEVSGTVSARDPLSIGAEASGLSVKQVLVEEGQYVKRNQPLAMLDSSVLQAQLQAAQARAAGSAATASKALQPNRPEDINGLRASLSQAQADVAQKESMVAQAQASLRNAQDIARRNSSVYAQGGISLLEARQHITDAQTAQESVHALEHQLQAGTFAVQQAQERLKLAQSGGRREDIISAQAVAAENRAQVQQLRAQIEQTIVRAPDDGLITERAAHIGEISTVGKSLFEMVRGGVLELRAQVTQHDLARVAAGNNATIGDGIRHSSGTVTDIMPAVDPSTRLATVRIRLTSNTGFLPGMFAHASISTGTQPALVVPQAAVMGDAGTYYVFTYQDGRAHRRAVTVGSRTRQSAQILSGLTPGDAIIVAGAGFLSDNDPVQLGR